MGQDQTKAAAEGLALSVAQRIFVIALGCIVTLGLTFIWTSVTGSSADVRKELKASMESMSTQLDEQGEALAEVKAENKLLRQEIGHLREIIQQGMDDRYRASDARRDFELRDLKIEALKRRVEKLEEKK